jgi:RluA family pseudouridine synthase
VKERRRELLRVDAKANGARLDTWLAAALPGVTRKAVKRALDGGAVFIDGITVQKAGWLLRGGESIAITLDVAAAEPPPVQFSIIYRDEYLLAMNKPAGLPAHPTVAGGPNALDLVRALPGLSEAILLHRLDADTTGVLLFALGSASNRELARQFAERQVEKVYLALVAGAAPAAFQVSNHLKAGVRGRTVVARSGGQAARTDFCTVQRHPGFTLVEARPHTGRTHQIRVHLAEEGCPLLGDTLYGGPTQMQIGATPWAVRRHLLHAWRLRIRHPLDGYELTLEAPIPADFEPFVACTTVNPPPTP